MGEQVTYQLSTSSWGQEEKAALYRVIETGMFTMGLEVARFEREFSAFVGSPYAVMVNSGSSANLLMVEALRYREKWPLRAVGNQRPRVIVPAVGWATTYSPLASWAHLVVVDIDRDTWGMDESGLREALYHGADAAITVNLLGNYDPHITGFPHLEDNCESLGATYQGRHAGTFGLMGSYSFFFSHHMSTMEGGMVVTADEELYHLLLSLRSHGWTRHLPQPNCLCVKGSDPFEESFRFIVPGLNVRPGELHGAVGIEQLAKLPEFIRIRRQNATRFKAIMADYPQFDTQKEVGESSWFGFGLVLGDKAPWDRKHVLGVFGDHGIETRPIVAGNFTRHPVIKHYKYSVPPEGLPNADRLHDRGFFIGNHHTVMDKEFEALEKALAAL